MVHLWSKLSPSLQPLSGVFLVVVPIDFPTSEVKYSHCVQLVSQMLCHSWLYFHANRQLWWLDHTRVEHLAFILAFKFYSHHFRLIHMVNACRLYFSLREHSYTKVWPLVWELEWGDHLLQKSSVDPELVIHGEMKYIAQGTNCFGINRPGDHLYASRRPSTLWQFKDFDPLCKCWCNHTSCHWGP